MPGLGTFTQTPPATTGFPFEQATIVRPSICLDAVSFASQYPNWATIANYVSSTGFSLNIIRSLSVGGLALKFDGGTSTYNITGSTPLFAASTESNIPTSKTYANVGSFPSGVTTSNLYVTYASGFYCAVTAKYYFAMRFIDYASNQGQWIFSIDPATGTIALLYNGPINGPSQYIYGGDGTNFFGQSTSYYAITSSTVITATGTMPAFFARTPGPTGFGTGITYFPLAVTATKLWSLQRVNEGGGNSSLLLQGIAKWTGGAPATVYKLIGKGAGTMNVPVLPGGPATNLNGYITASATAGAYDIIAADSFGNYNVFAGLMV